MTFSAQSETQRGVTSSSRPSVFSYKRLSGGTPPKIAVIREELVDLTENPFTAVVLNQILYWTERLPDLDQLVREELGSESTATHRYGWFYKSSEELAEESLIGFDRRTIRRYLNDFIEKGWLSERHNPKNKWDKTTQYRMNIKQLYLDLRAIGYDLPGFPLEEFRHLEVSLPVTNKMLNPSIQCEDTSQNTSISASHSNGHSNAQDSHHENETLQNTSISALHSNGHSNAQQWTFECHPNGHSNVIQSAFFNLTETTTETTSREHAERARENQEVFEEEEKVESSSSTIPTTSSTSNPDPISASPPNSVSSPVPTSTSTQESDQTQAMAPGVLAPASASLPPPVPAQAQAQSPAPPSVNPATEASSKAEVMLKIWEESVGLSPIHLNENRKSQLKSILERHFHEDMSHWKAFCHRVKSSPFLMGEGGRRWRVTLDWILEEKNLIKVLEGNFDDGSGVVHRPPQQLQTQPQVQGPYEIEFQALLSTIKDPTWKAWCTDLVGRQLAFNDRIPIFILKHIVRVKFLEREGHLAWLECEDQGVLNQIENLRLSLLSVVQRTYPEIRNIRTKTPNRIYP